MFYFWNAITLKLHEVITVTCKPALGDGFLLRQRAHELCGIALSLISRKSIVGRFVTFPNGLYYFLLLGHHPQDFNTVSIVHVMAFQIFV